MKGSLGALDTKEGGKEVEMRQRISLISSADLTVMERKEEEEDETSRANAKNRKGPPAYLRKAADAGSGLARVLAEGFLGVRLAA